MFEERQSGIFMHISSLPGSYGIGTLGSAAYEFVDFLHETGQSVWQILPLVPTGFGDSPYQSCSTKAGNPYFIDLDILHDQGLLSKQHYTFTDFGNNPDRVDYAKLYSSRFTVLKISYETAKNKISAEIKNFVRQQGAWLEEYSLFMALKEHFGMVELSAWPDKKCIRRDTDTLNSYKTKLKDSIGFYVFLQYCFYKQWFALKQYANDLGIKIMGDIPIYASADSAEVWTNPELFQVDALLKTKVVAGVPPDAFSETGQLWGNPLYDWPAHEKDGFSWWIDRLKHAESFYDIVRIDHFRGIYNYWEIDAKDTVAVNGRWRQGPGMAWVEKVTKALPKLELVAEDLGDLDDDVRAFFKQTKLPGMNVLVFGLDPDGGNEHTLHNLKEQSVIYTSLHDSETFIGWLQKEADQRQIEFSVKYLRLTLEDGFNWGAVAAVWGAVSKLAIAPMQDILGLGSDARMNLPGTLRPENWSWRMRKEAVNNHVSDRLVDITKTYSRYRKKPPKRDSATDAVVKELES